MSEPEGPRLEGSAGLLRLARGDFADPSAGLRAAWRRLRSIARKEIRQLGRDPLTLGFVVFVPLVQLVLFGYAINQDPPGRDRAG